MLTKFAVTNYRGFAKRIEWDLSHPANYGFNTHVIKDGTIKSGILYGPNGSGKSNFSLALFDIVNHLSQKVKMPYYYENFIYVGDTAGVVTFEYTFQFDDEHVEYVYSKNAKGALLTETLKVNNVEVIGRTKERLFFSSEFVIDKGVREQLEANANYLSMINYLISSSPLDSGHYLLKIRRFVDSMLWFRCLDNREFIGLEINPRTNVDEYIIANNLVDDFADFLLQVSGQIFRFTAHYASDKFLRCVIDDCEVPFHLIASTGTQALHLLYYWLQRMGEASFVFIDEFDAFYHFRLAFEVCQRLFRLPCQVFASSHNTYLMTNDLLRPDCNFVLNNNQIKSLADCTDKELRFAHNIEKIYRGGGFNE